MFTQLPVYLYLTSLYLYLKKTYWRPEDRWLCGGDGLGVMRYGYPGLPPTLTPGRKRDTITSVKSEQQERKKPCLQFSVRPCWSMVTFTFFLDALASLDLKLSVSESVSKGCFSDFL